MLKTRTWFTENTEILSTQHGWVDIKKALALKEVIGISDDNLIATNLVEFNIIDYKGEIDKYQNQNYFITGKNIIFPNNKIWRVSYGLEILSPEKMYYEGLLYNIVTSSNTLITRNYTHNLHHFNDYTLTLCQSVQ